MTLMRTNNIALVIKNNFDLGELEISDATKEVQTFYSGSENGRLKNFESFIDVSLFKEFQENGRL